MTECPSGRASLGLAASSAALFVMEMCGLFHVAQAVSDLVGASKQATPMRTQIQKTRAS